MSVMEKFKLKTAAIAFRFSDDGPKSCLEVEGVNGHALSIDIPMLKALDMIAAETSECALVFYIEDLRVKPIPRDRLALFERHFPNHAIFDTRAEAKARLRSVLEGKIRDLDDSIGTI